MIKISTKNLTPRKAWEDFVGMSEEMFLSNFRYEVPEMDIGKMCKIYTQELPIIFETDRVSEGILFTDNQLEEIEKLLVIHLEGYIESKGGIKNLILYTEEELEEIQQQQYEIILDGLSQKTGASKDEIKNELRKIGAKRKNI